MKYLSYVFPYKGTLNESTEYHGVKHSQECKPLLVVCKQALIRRQPP